MCSENDEILDGECDDDEYLTCSICGERLELEEDEEPDACTICGRIICACCIGFIGDCNAYNVFCEECTEEVRKNPKHSCHECVIEADKEAEREFQ